MRSQSRRVMYSFMVDSSRYAYLPALTRSMPCGVLFTNTDGCVFSMKFHIFLNVSIDEVYTSILFEKCSVIMHSYMHSCSPTLKKVIVDPPKTVPYLISV